MFRVGVSEVSEVVWISNSSMIHFAIIHFAITPDDTITARRTKVRIAT